MKHLQIVNTFLQLSFAAWSVTTSNYFNIFSSETHFEYSAIYQTSVYIHTHNCGSRPWAPRLAVTKHVKVQSHSKQHLRVTSSGYLILYWYHTASLHPHLPLVLLHVVVASCLMSLDRALGKKWIRFPLWKCIQCHIHTFHCWSCGVHMEWKYSICNTGNSIVSSDYLNALFHAGHVCITHTCGMQLFKEQPQLSS